jgi:hypothetical protein
LKGEKKKKKKKSGTGHAKVRCGGGGGDIVKEDMGLPEGLQYLELRNISWWPKYLASIKSLNAFLAIFLPKDSAKLLALSLLLLLNFMFPFPDN